MDQDISAGTDVLVIGGGAAALSAAISAREKGARVLLLECSPKHFRGGNSRHTRNMRLAHETMHPLYTGLYPEEEMWTNYLNATGGTGDLVKGSYDPASAPDRASMTQIGAGAASAGG